MADLVYNCALALFRLKLGKTCLVCLGLVLSTKHLFWVVLRVKRNRLWSLRGSFPFPIKLASNCYFKGRFKILTNKNNVSIWSLLFSTSVSSQRDFIYLFFNVFSMVPPVLLEFNKRNISLIRVSYHWFQATIQYALLLLEWKTLVSLTKTSIPGLLSWKHFSQQKQG